MSKTVSPDILQSLSDAISGLAERTEGGVVGIGSGGRTGSGIVWDGEGHLVTAYHVMRGVDRVEVGTQDSRFTAKVVGHNRRSDLALLQAETSLTPVAKGSSSDAKVGQFVLALANSFSKASITSGVITGVGRSFGGWWGVMVEDAIVSDVRVTPGYSGGPLVDSQGRLLGVNIASVSSRAVTVPVHLVSKIVESLVTGKSVRRAYLGVVTSTVPLPENISGEASQGSGLIVLSVEDGSPAQKGGLVFGDVLLEFGGRTLQGTQELGALLTEDVVGKPTKLRLMRGGKPNELTVTPGEAQED